MLKKYLGVVLIIGVLFLFVSNVLAESPRGKHITEIEKVLQKIEKSKVIEPNDDAMIDKYLNEHTQNMEKELGAVKSDKNKLQKLQKEAKGHDTKLKGIQKRINNIEKKVMNGDIKFSKGLLQGMQKSEIDEFKKSLTPKGLKMYEKEYPDIFKSGTKKVRYNLNHLLTTMHFVHRVPQNFSGIFLFLPHMPVFSVVNATLLIKNAWQDVAHNVSGTDQGAVPAEIIAPLPIMYVTASAMLYKNLIVQ